MAKLVSILRSDDHPLDVRQLPLVVDDSLTMVVQLSHHTCSGCSQVKQKESDRFVTRFKALSSDEIAAALVVTNAEIMDVLCKMVPCVGCRKSVERLFGQLVSSCQPALEPLVITPTSALSIRRDILFEPKLLFALMYVHGSHFQEVMDSIPKSKKNKRCQLHSLDSYKVNTARWEEIWDVMTQVCREEVLLIKNEAFVQTMDLFLQRFCGECKATLQRAYQLLVKEIDSQSELEYCAALYYGIRCKNKSHIHILCDPEFIKNLIERAEPELTGIRSERHVKTITEAQLEMLTCLGIHVYERLHKIWQKLREEEQTWQILFYLGVDMLRKNYEVALEKKQGISNLELMCKELQDQEIARQQKKKNKKEKKKMKKSKKAEDVSVNRCEKNQENCSCDKNMNLPTLPCNSCNQQHNSVNGGHKVLQPDCDGGGVCKCDGESASASSAVGCKVCTSRSDCGYSSRLDDCDGCSQPSSRDGSDIACSKGICNQQGDAVLCQRGDEESWGAAPGRHDHLASPLLCSTWPLNRAAAYSSQQRRSMDSEDQCGHSLFGGGQQLSLLEVYDSIDGASSSGEEDEDLIPQEEIQQFKANQTHLNAQRKQFRQKLRQQFANFQVKHNCQQGCQKKEM